MRQNIIGREQEQDTLLSLQQSSMSEFVAISGRRRIGKTFLVNELFEGQLLSGQLVYMVWTNERS